MKDLFAKAEEILDEEIAPGMELIRSVEMQTYYEYLSLCVVKDTGIWHKPETAQV